MVYSGVDGKCYDKYSDIPDYGSIRCITWTKGNVRELEGLSADATKLPTTIGAGSSFFALDTSNVYKFNDSTKAWIQL